MKCPVALQIVTANRPIGWADQLLRNALPYARAFLREKMAKDWPADGATCLASNKTIRALRNGAHLENYRKSEQTMIL